MNIFESNRLFLGRIAIFLLVLGQLFLQLSFTAQAAVIVAFGDSITEGRECGGSGGYEARLETLLDNNDRASTVTNQGLSGENTTNGLSRFDSALSGSNADMVLILEGTNDWVFGISLETTEFNLGEMIRKSEESFKVVPLISTLLPDTSSNGWKKHIETTYNPMIQNLATSKGVTLVDQYSALAGNWSSWNCDGKHPNDSGEQAMAETWYATLSSMIGSGGAALVAVGDESSDSCFIATAAFGSKFEPHVRLLREFRDIYLLPNSLGRKFVEFYYQVSPPIAGIIADNETLRKVVRFSLYPLIVLSYFLLKFSFVEKLFTVCLLGACGWLLVRRFLGRGKHFARQAR